MLTMGQDSGCDHLGKRNPAPPLGDLAEAHMAGSTPPIPALFFLWRSFSEVAGLSVSLSPSLCFSLAFFLILFSLPSPQLPSLRNKLPSHVSSGCWCVCPQPWDSQSHIAPHNITPGPRGLQSHGQRKAIGSSQESGVVFSVKKCHLLRQ